MANTTKTVVKAKTHMRVANRWAVKNIKYPDLGLLYYSGYYKSAQDVRNRVLIPIHLDHVYKVVYLPKYTYHPIADGEIE